MPRGPPPRPPAAPVVGHALRWARDPLTLGSWANDEVGGVARIGLFGKELVLVTDPEPIEEVLVEKRTSFPKSEQYAVAFGEGLGSVSGDQWRTQRDVATEFFRPSRVDAYADRIVSLTASMADGWTVGDEVALFDEVKALTLQILFETVFDHRIDPWGEDAHVLEAVDDLQKWFEPTSWVLPEWVPTPARRRFAAAAAEVDAIAVDLLENAGAEAGLLATLQELDRRGAASLTDEELTSQLRTFLFAGHETTAVTTSLALVLLSERPALARRFHTELDTVLGGRPPTLDDLDDLAVTDNVVRETLRLYPPAFRLPRVAASDVEIDGFQVDAGTDVLVYAVTPQRDDRFWEAPREFRPSRWDDRDPDATGFEYIPFGAGPRRCIAERFALVEMRLVLATLGRTHAFEPLSDVEISASISASPEGSLPVRLERP